MYAQLGSTIFETLFSFDSYKKETQTKYAEIPLIGGKPDLQRTGLTLDTIVFSLRLHNSFCDPSIRYSELETYRINGDILPFLDGSGNLIGNFIIEKITQTIEQTDPKGTVICSNLEVELKEYVDPDRLAARKAAAQRGAFALDAKAATINTGTLNLTPKADVFASLQLANAGTSATAVNIGNALSRPSQAEAWINLASRSIEDVQQGIVDVQAKMTQYVSAIVSPVGFADSLVTAATCAANLASAIRSGDISSLDTDMSLLTGAIAGMNIASQPMERLIILRQ